MAKKKYSKKRYFPAKRRKTNPLKRVFCIVLCLIIAVSASMGWENGSFSFDTMIDRLEVLEEELDISDYGFPVFEAIKEYLPTIKSPDGQSEGNLLYSIPAYSGKAYAVIGDNKPDFSKAELSREPYEFYSELDSLGRCGYAMAMIDKSIMPVEKRTAIGSVKPSGWHAAKYDCVDGKYLYNRCHLIAYMLTGENANEKNLITGTRYLNIEGMLPFESMVNDYIKETGGRVLYRVTPVFEGSNLVACGVRMEGMSVEDDEICFDVFAYNVQPGVGIDYANGNSWLE